MARIPNVNVGGAGALAGGQAAQTHSAGDAAGSVGGRRVTPSIGQRIRRGVSDAFSAIGSAFRAFGNRVTTFFGTVKANHQLRQANAKAASAARALSGDDVNVEKTTTKLQSLLAAAEKLDPANPAGKAAELMQNAVGNLPVGRKAAFVGLDFAGLTGQVDGVVDRQFGRLAQLETALGEHFADIEPTDNTQEANTLKGNLRTLLTGMNPIADIARRDVLLAELPTGMTIDAGGFTGGSHPLINTPADATKLNAEQRGVSVLDAVSMTMTSGLNGNSTTLANGIEISNQSSSDIYRLDLHLNTGPGQVYHSRADGESNQHTRNNTAVTHLRQITGDDRATKVLASTLNQSILRVFHESLQKADGTAVNMKFANRNHYIGRQPTMKTPGGSQNVNNLAQYGNASWTVDRTPSGDYRVSIDWPMYAIGYGNPSKSLPLEGDDDMIRADFSIEFIVDANEARQGRLSVEMPNPATVSFTGGLDI